MDDAGAADPGMGRAQPARVLPGLLGNPRVLLVALASDGVIVPMPASVDVSADRVLSAPGERATLLELVVPADSMAVITTWERTREQGVALATVHLKERPERALALTFLDTRAQFGVYLGALDVLQETDTEGPQALEPVTVARRPRTATVTKSVLAVITDVDERTTRMLGWSREEMLGKRSSEFIHPDDQERAIATWMELLSRQDAQRVRLRHRRADGTWAWLELENLYEPADDPADAVVVAHMTDISDEMAAHEALQQRERLLRRVAESLPVGIAQLATDETVVYANSRLAAILGVDEVHGVADVADAVAEVDRPELDRALQAALSGQADTELEVRVRPVDGAGPRVCSLSLVSLSDREGVPGALLCLADVTDSAHLREELTAQATFDVLTGCRNRAATFAFLEESLRAADAATAVLFVDLDNLKPINDTLGHDAGDELLALTAARMAGVLRRDDIIGRLGGDEFLIVSRGLGSVDEAMAMGRRVQEALAGPVVLGAGLVELRASIGVAIAEPGAAAGEVIKRADQAMYLSKQDGCGRPVLSSDAF